MDKILSITKAIADRNRMRILIALTNYEELCACQITEFLKVTGATVSRHLAIMVKAGLLKSRKDGRWIYFSIDQEENNKSIINWLKIETREAGDIASDTQNLQEIVSHEPGTICRRQRGESCCPPEQA